ncbi:MAG TPA: hypothetical protein DCG79_04125, partial [Clostridiales bacterium]|nr:hypothetical protein [Clostridiales bacterium]
EPEPPVEEASPAEEVEEEVPVKEPVVKATEEPQEEAAEAEEKEEDALDTVFEIASDGLVIEV